MKPVHVLAAVFALVVGVLGGLALVNHFPENRPFLALEQAMSIDAATSTDSAAPIPEALHTVTIASFKNGDQLDECVDFTGTGASLDWGSASKVDAGFAKGKVVIAQTCNEAFADRTVLGTCFVSTAVARKVRKDDAGGVEMNAQYFRTATLDRAMKDCLEVRGEWHAIARNSDDYRREHIRQLVDQAQHLADPEMSRGRPTPDAQTSIATSLADVLGLMIDRGLDTSEKRKAA